MKRIQVFDPPLCCSTGVCGPSVDPALVRFAADLEWLEGEGVEVARHNLAQDPAAFAEVQVVVAALEKEGGNDCLPLVLADGAIVSRGRYPNRAELAAWAGLAPSRAGTDDARAGVVLEMASPGCDPSSGCCD